MRSSNGAQDAATKPASEISDPVILAMRGSMTFSLIFRLLRERAAPVEYRFGLSHAEQISGALDEIEAITKRIRERVL
jgi:hypothetical protein